jgi:hypothetical protein
METAMKYVTRFFAIVIAVIGLLVLLPSLPFIAGAGICLLLAAAVANIHKPKSDADTKA